MNGEKKGDDIYIVSPEKFSQSTAALTDIIPEKKKDFKDTDDEDDPDIKCGLGSWTPKWLQRGANTKLFLFFYSMAGLSQGAHFTYMVGCMTTLEKRFAYDSKRSGIVMISDEIAPIILGALIGYFGGFAHRPKLLTIGMLIGAVSSFIMALPYFIYGPASNSVAFQQAVSRVPGVKAQFCDKEYNSLLGECGESITTPVLTIFFMSNFLKGLSGCIFYTIGTSYMDDSIKKKNSPMYLGSVVTSNKQLNERFWQHLEW
ncbi:Solute carrier organic anion transporter family member 4A1 [Araneus ventricosus]|uniref:Solute carrier organic anion transporter family member 4A1 n=1 Tax=Araneus ventricosus TaxID=182803 RepID=A0A4Y2BST5_ARAVE|nr:Solute carrier organic anion transporter family member 4A1 [Araneus ventricosus]